MQENFLGKWLWRIVMALFFAFAIYSNIHVFIRNKSYSELSSQSQAEVDTIKQRNKRLQLLLTYYQTQSYQETEARRRLGLKKPDETAVIVKGASTSAESDQLANQDLFEAVQTQPTVPVTNISQWWQYFFGKK